MRFTKVSFKIALFSILFLGHGAFAAYSKESPSKIGSMTSMTTINSWVSYLNSNYDQPQHEARFRSSEGFSGLNLEVTGDLRNADIRKQVVFELQMLEDMLQGLIHLPEKALKVLACGRPVCDGGGDGGKCRTCAIEPRDEGSAFFN